jgi:hypothetical protein
MNKMISDYKKLIRALNGELSPRERSAILLEIDLLKSRMGL